MIESRFSMFQFLSILPVNFVKLTFFPMKQFNLYVFKSLESGIVG